MNKADVLNRDVDVDVRSGAPLSVVISLSITALLAALYYKILYSLGTQWYADPDYSHGFLVPLLSGYFVWERRERLRSLPVAPSPWGIILLGGGLLMLLIGSAGAELYMQRTSIIVVIAGLVLLMLGGSFCVCCFFLSLSFFLLFLLLPFLLMWFLFRSRYLRRKR